MPRSGELRAGIRSYIFRTGCHLFLGNALKYHPESCRARKTRHSRPDWRRSATGRSKQEARRSERFAGGRGMKGLWLGAVLAGTFVGGMMLSTPHTAQAGCPFKKSSCSDSDCSDCRGERFCLSKLFPFLYRGDCCEERRCAAFPHYRIRRPLQLCGCNGEFHNYRIRRPFHVLTCYSDCRRCERAVFDERTSCRK